MVNLTPPSRQYITGKRPTHSTSQNLEDHFEGLNKELMQNILGSSGYLNNGKPTKRALEDGLLDVCKKSVLWNLNKIEQFLRTGGINAQRKNANQNIQIGSSSGTPHFGSLTTIATYFNVSSVQVGKWLDKYGYRDEVGEPLEKYIKNGLAKVVVMPGKKNKGKSYVQWDVPRTVEILKAQGHALDFDYNKSLEGKGKNSDVKVITIDDKVKDFLKNFTKLYNAGDRGCIRLVNNTPRAILQRAEKKLQRPGFLLQGKFKNKF